MHNPYILETVNRYRREDLLREAQQRRMHTEWRAGRPRATSRPLFLQRVRLAVRWFAATGQIRSKLGRS